MSKHKMHNNSYQQNKSARPTKSLAEGLQYQDLDGMVKPTIHVDEFSSKMGDDADVMVLSFYVRDKAAARDLVSWFEKGYDFVLDADRSPGEIKPNRYLVYVEMRRRSSAPQNIQHLLSDLTTLCEHADSDWMVRYKNNDFAWNEEEFARQVPLTPDAYRSSTDSDLNEWRVAAGLPVKKIHQSRQDLRELQAAAGII